MLSSWPQTKADYDPLRRPKGTINSYVSVVNTAKDKKLLRHRIREIVLAIALTVGFHKNEKRARQIYGDNERRVSQCTFLYAKSIVCPQHKREFSNKMYELPAAMYKTVRQYFKNNGTELYDTKKFRIYCKRLEYGPKNRHGIRKIALRRTIQYMSTPLLACMFGLFGGNVLTKQGAHLDISCLDFFKRAYSKKETVREIQKYLDIVLHVQGVKISRRGHIIFLTDEAKEAFWQTINREAETLYGELEGGGYLGNKE